MKSDISRVNGGRITSNSSKKISSKIKVMIHDILKEDRKGIEVLQKL